MLLLLSNKMATALRNAMVSTILDRWHKYHHSTITEAQYYSKGMCCDRSYDVGVKNGILLTPYQLEHSTQAWTHCDYLCPLPTVEWCQQLIHYHNSNSRVIVNLDTCEVSPFDHFEYYSLWDPLVDTVRRHLPDRPVLQDSFITSLRKDRVGKHSAPPQVPQAPPRVAQLPGVLSESLCFNIFGHHNALSLHDLQHAEELLN